MSKAAPASTSPDRPLPIAAILIMIAKGMTPRDILTVFPELTLPDISTALLQAAELLKDPDASLVPSHASVSAIIEKARQSSNLSEEEAMELAVAATRTYRKEKAARKGT
jgi:hypothetical protein